MTTPDRTDGDGLPDDIRAQGWAIAVHNDYRQDGVPHTFWLFTKDGMAVKGEGASDVDALNQVRAALRTAPQPPDTGEGTGALSYDEKVEMLKLADDIAGAEIADFDTAQAQIITRALRIAGDMDAAPPKPAPDALREALRREDDRRLPSYGQIPWKQLGRDVMDAMYAKRTDYEFDPSYYPGHQMLPPLNFNSLARIVDKYRYYALSLQPTGDQPTPQVNAAGALPPVLHEREAPNA